MDIVTKRAAQSGRGSWAEPAVIMESSIRKIQLRPFYYTTNSGEERLTLGIDVYVKDRKATEWTKSKEKSFAVQAERVEEFYKATRRFRALLGVEDEEEVLITTIPDHDDLVQLEPSKLLKAAGTLLKGNHEQFEHFNLEQDLVSAIAGHMKFQTLSNATRELQHMAEDETLTEASSQTWFEENYWAFGSAYIARDEVRTISPSDSVDLLLERTGNGLRDIVEIKRPSTEVLRYDTGRDVYSFSASTSAAIGQCARYLDVFEQMAGKGGLIDSPQIIARQPKAIIVIGRSNDWTIQKRHSLHRLNARLHGIEIKTFDDVIAEARCLLDLIGVKTRDIPEIESIPF